MVALVVSDSTHKLCVVSAMKYISLEWERFGSNGKMSGKYLQVEPTTFDAHTGSNNVGHEPAVITWEVF